MPRLNNNKKNQAEAPFFPESGRAMKWFLSSEHCPGFLLGVCHLSIQTEKSSDGRTRPYFSCCHSLPLSYFCKKISKLLSAHYLFLTLITWPFLLVEVTILLITISHFWLRFIENIKKIL